MKYIKLFENFINSELILENFFLLSDKEKENPITQSIMNAVVQKLGVKLKSELKPVEASGAEGIVLSIDDFRVVKFFHSIQNAAKSIPLLSKKYDFTAKVFGAGKINLDQDVVYFRPNSTYSKEEAVPTKVIYYLVMERVRPDELTYQDVELFYEKINRLSNLRYDTIRELFKIEDPKLKSRLKEIISNFLIEKERIQKDGDPIDYLQSLEKKDRNILMNDEFSKWIKLKTKEFLLSDNQDKPLILKRFLINHIGLDKNLPELISTDYDIKKIFEFISGLNDFNRRGRNGKIISESYNEIKNLISHIIVDNKIKWNDIHNGQFARNKAGELIALDLGVKSDINAESYFNKNVSRISLKGETKLVESIDSNGPQKKINFFDFDSTLFQTEGRDEGIRHWEEVFGRKYPHIGWISKDESLALELDIKPVYATLDMYEKLNTPDSVNVLLSDRLPKMKAGIVQNLDKYNIKMDYFLFNTGPHKVDRLKEFILDFDVYEINLFDDKKSVIEKFLEFRELYNLWRPDMVINIYLSKDGELIEM
jgi:hypothetical protein